MAILYVYKEVRTLKIKKVDDKPMVIHTKEKAKIHSHEPKGARTQHGRTIKLVVIMI